MGKLKANISRLDLKIALAVAICLVTAKFVPVIQYMAACFAAILCIQDEVKVSWKTGINRLILTAVGGGVGIIVILLDQVIQNEWIFILLVTLGIVLTLWGCKVARVPYINARIGGITFILIVMIASGTARIDYAIMRLLGTFYGVLVSLAITGFFGLFGRKKRKKLMREESN